MNKNNNLSSMDIKEILRNMNNTIPDEICSPDKSVDQLINTPSPERVKEALNALDRLKQAGEQNKMENIHNMNLHEEIVAHDGNVFTVCLRVPGGWIYNSYDKSNQIMGSVFVPYCAEFSRRTKPDALPPSSDGQK